MSWFPSALPISSGLKQKFFSLFCKCVRCVLPRAVFIVVAVVAGFVAAIVVFHFCILTRNSKVQFPNCVASVQAENIPNSFNSFVFCIAVSQIKRDSEKSMKTKLLMG